MILTNDNDESRRMIESCYRLNKTTLNPIIDWEDRDVWKFIRAENVSYCDLYDEGFCRLGCIGCPLAGQRNRAEAFRRWPKYKGFYLHAFEKMLNERRENGLATDWKTPEEVFNWWMQYGILPNQYSFCLEEIYD